MLRTCFYICALLVLAIGTTAASAESPRAQDADTATADSNIPTGRLPRTVQPVLVELELKVDPEDERFAGTTSIHAEVAEPTDVIWMHGRDLDVQNAQAVLPDGSRIALDAEQVHVSGVLKLTAAENIPAGKVVIDIAFEAPFGNLMGAYRVKPADEYYVVTQMEPLGARNTFPGFDEPSFKQPWDVTLIVPDDDLALANAPEARTEDLDGPFKKIVFERTEALPTYLVAFAVGPWDLAGGGVIAPHGQRDEPIPLRGIAARGEGERLSFALANTPVIVHALEDYFGIPYPFAKLDNVAAPDFGAGAMENAGLIVYRDTLMLLDEDAPAGQRRAFWGVSAHELAHQWFGNLVTMEWWNDLWLNEAFASWMGNKITGQLKPEFHADRNMLERALYAMKADSLASARRIRQPIDDFTQIASAFDSITYMKGGAVLAMFEKFIGENAFRDGIRAYLADHARGNATSTDLIESVAAQSEQPKAIAAAFRSFVDQAGVPMLRIDVECAESEPPALTIAQQRYLPLGSSASAEQTWGIPMCVRYAAGNGVEEQCGLVSGAQARFELTEAQSCPAWVMPNAHGNGYYTFALSPDWQQRLSDAFDSLDAQGQRVYADSVMAAYGAGDLSVSQLIAALPRFATADSRQTATAGMDSVEWIAEHLLHTDAERTRLREHYAAIYRPLLNELGLEEQPGETDEERLLRTELIDYFANTLEDEAVRAAMAERGNAVLGLDAGGKLDAAAVERSLRGTAIAAAVQEGGEAAFALAEKHLRASDDAVLRRELLLAMGSVSDATIAQRARSLILEPNLLRLNELMLIPYSQTDDPALRAALRDWLDSHYEELQEKLSPGGSSIVNAYAAGMCSAEQAADLEDRFAERVQSVEGGPLNLKQTVEEIGLCAAARQARDEQEIKYVNVPAP